MRTLLTNHIPDNPQARITQSAKAPRLTDVTDWQLWDTRRMAWWVVCFFAWQYIILIVQDTSPSRYYAAAIMRTILEFFFNEYDVQL